MTEKSYSATEVKNRFGKVLREAARYGEPIVVNRDGKPVAVIMSIEAYERTQKNRPKARRSLTMFLACGQSARI